MQIELTEAERVLLLECVEECTERWAKYWPIIRVRARSRAMHLLKAKLTPAKSGGSVKGKTVRNVKEKR